jgi:hypothetical protein
LASLATRRHGDKQARESRADRQPIGGQQSAEKNGACSDRRRKLQRTNHLSKESMDDWLIIKDETLLNISMRYFLS